jgi:hypothetical protein
MTDAAGDGGIRSLARSLAGAARTWHRRFGVLEHVGPAEVEHNPKNNRMRAR